MAAETFDTLVYSKKLKAAGCPEQQADVHAEQAKIQADSISEFINENIATKKDLENLATKVDLKDMQISLIKWMIGLLGGWAAILISVMSAFKFLH